MTGGKGPLRETVSSARDRLPGRVKVSSHPTRSSPSELRRLGRKVGWVDRDRLQARGPKKVSVKSCSVGSRLDGRLCSVNVSWL
jgi:hypothetical protein